LTAWRNGACILILLEDAADPFSQAEAGPELAPAPRQSGSPFKIGQDR
jgi:hypothetical protein